MSIVGKRAEPNDLRNSFSAATFRKVLKGFEIGGLPYTEVQFQLKRLLATGVSPGELREVLRRSELIEPLPEYAYREVLGLLDEAIEQDAALQTDPDGAIDHAEELDPAALAAELQDARGALESEQTRAREAEEALSVRIAAEEAVRSRLDTTLRESERYQAELRAARNSIASRDKVTAQMRQTVDERDTELAAVRREHAELAAARAEIERSLTDSNSLSGAAREKLASQEGTLAELRQTLAQRDAQLDALKRERSDTLTSLESRAKSAAQLQADLQAARAQTASLAAELGTARGALDSERRESLASQEKTLAELQQTLAQRDAQLNVLRRERADTLTSLEARAKNAAQLQADLQASQGKTLAEMRQTLAEREALVATLRQGHTRAIGESEEKLHAAQERLAAAKSDLNSSRAQVANLQGKQRDSDAQIEKLSASLRSEAKRAAQWQAAAQNRTSEAAVTSPRAEVLPLAQAVTASGLLSRFLLRIRGWRWNFPKTPRAAWIGAASVLLATAIWFVVHRPSPVTSSPAASTTSLMQAGTAVQPTDQFDQGSAAAQSGSAIEKPPHVAITPAARPVTAGARPNSDFQRCRAGGIDACYDAIRWKPSDPSLLSALGDALLRANRPADALRTYQRVAILAPNTPGVAAKIGAIEAKLSAKHAPGSASAKSH